MAQKYQNSSIQKTTTILANPLILHIESATDVCSVCISSGKERLAIHESAELNGHARNLTVFITKTMEMAGTTLEEIDAVAISAGPGSYTSLRVGASVAKGICYTLQKPLIAVPTLLSLALATAAQVKEPAALYCPMIDARRMEVYCEVFDGQGTVVQPLGAAIIDEQAFSNFFLAGKTVVFSGNGAEKCKKTIHSQLAVFSGPQACSATYLIEPALRFFLGGTFADPAYFIPTYFKNPNITASSKKKDIII